MLSRHWASTHTRSFIFQTQRRLSMEEAKQFWTDFNLNLSAPLGYNYNEFQIESVTYIMFHLRIRITIDNWIHLHGLHCLQAKSQMFLLVNFFCKRKKRKTFRSMCSKVKIFIRENVKWKSFNSMMERFFRLGRMKCWKHVYHRQTKTESRAFFAADIRNFLKIRFKGKPEKWKFCSKNCLTRDNLRSHSLILLHCARIWRGK